MHAIDAQLSITDGLENTLKSQVEADGHRLKDLRAAIAAQSPETEIHATLNALLDSNAKLAGALASFEAIANTPAQAPLDQPVSQTSLSTGGATITQAPGERYDSATDDVAVASDDTAAAR